MLSEQVSAGVIMFFILYGISGVMPLMAALYLLLRRGNAFAPGVTPPARLRHWTTSFFAFSSLTHIWWMLFFIYSNDLDSVGYELLVVIDCVLMLTTIAGTMLSMLQDRRRPVWPTLVAMLPFLAMAGRQVVYPSETFQLIGSFYLLLLCLAFSLYMVFAIRQYGRWLNDNYADMENKKVWLSQTVAFLCLLLFGVYIFAIDMVLICLLHVIDLVLFCLLLWRVETLPTLTTGEVVADEPEPPLASRRGGGAEAFDLDNISALLAERCVGRKLFLQHDLTLQQLAHSIGTNRSYLSQYFSRQGITYNIYINNLRINYFISRYEESVRTQSLSAQQLAQESGFRSYSTFARAFMQRTGQSVSEWTRDAAE